MIEDLIQIENTNYGLNKKLEVFNLKTGYKLKRQSHCAYYLQINGKQKCFVSRYLYNKYLKKGNISYDEYRKLIKEMK